MALAQAFVCLTGSGNQIKGKAHWANMWWQEVEGEWVSDLSERLVIMVALACVSEQAHLCPNAKQAVVCDELTEVCFSLINFYVNKT